MIAHVLDPAPDVGNIPSFLPTQAAGASAAFAGILAAITLGVSVQLVFQRDQPNRTSLSVAVAPVAFLTLVISTYLYVRLAGRFDQTSRFIEAQDAGLHGIGIAGSSDLFGSAHVTAALFASAGCLLATGAPATLLLIALAIHEHTADETTRKVGSFVFYTGFVAAAVFWVDGLYEIYSILRVEDLDTSDPEQLIPPGLARSGWYILALLVVPGVAGFIAGQQFTKRRLSQKGLNSLRSWPFACGLIALWCGTVTWSAFLDSRKSFNGPGEMDLTYCGFWMACFASALGVMSAVEIHSRARVFPPESEVETHLPSPDPQIEICNQLDVTLGRQLLHSLGSTLHSFVKLYLRRICTCATKLLVRRMAVSLGSPDRDSPPHNARCSSTPIDT